MNEYRYTLQPYTGRNSRYTCPLCRKPHEFSRYIDTETGEMLADEVGKCNRIDKCGYHYTPKQYFTDKGIKPEPVKEYVPKQERPRPVSYIDNKIFHQSLKGYDNNYLIKYLNSIFDFDTVDLLINLYKIGTSSRYGGGTTVFWQIDNDMVRAGKLIRYAENGHRVHGQNNWVHSVLKLDNFNLKQCLFGEHILKHAPDATVCIVESEKTAIIATVFMPEMVWLATGGAENLNKEKMKVLRGRKVILFPDASKDGRIYQKWEFKAKDLGFDISDLLEKEATPEQKAEGVDIADFLITQDWQQFRHFKPVKEALPPIVHDEVTAEKQPKKDRETVISKDWNNDISKLETFFKSIELPIEPVKLNDWTTITDTTLFVESSLSTVKQYNGNKVFLPYLNRLQTLKQILVNNKN